MTITNLAISNNHSGAGGDGADCGSGDGGGANGYGSYRGDGGWGGGIAELMSSSDSSSLTNIKI